LNLAILNEKVSNANTENQAIKIEDNQDNLALEESREIDIKSLPRIDGIRKELTKIKE